MKVELFELSESKVNIKNTEGLKLQKEFTYEKTLNQILKILL